MTAAAPHGGCELLDHRPSRKGTSGLRSLLVVGSSTATELTVSDSSRNMTLSLEACSYPQLVESDENEQITQLFESRR